MQEHPIGHGLFHQGLCSTPQTDDVDTSHTSAQQQIDSRHGLECMQAKWNVVDQT